MAVVSVMPSLDNLAGFSFSDIIFWPDVPAGTSFTRHGNPSF